MDLGAKPDLEATLLGSGGRMHVEHHRPRAEAKLAVVMVHGYAAHCGLYRHVGAALAADGIAVTQFDCRGHGRSEGRRGHVDGFAEYVDDLATVIAWARDRNQGLPWALVGHSLGGTIALAYMLDDGRADKPTRSALVAPWLRLKMDVAVPKQLAAGAAAKVLPTLTVPNGLRAEDLSRNPLVQANFDQDPLVHHVATAGWFRSTLRAQARIRAHAERLRVPTLLVLAGDDRIVANAASLAIARTAGPTIETRTYDGLFHEVLLEPAADAVIGDIAAWLLAAK